MARGNLDLARNSRAHGGAQVKIAFIGAHSTGKSTLLAACKRHFGRRIYPIENIARRLIARGIKLGAVSDAEGLLRYLAAQLDAEERADPEADIVISDRTCIDSVAYATANEQLGLCKVPDFVLDALRSIAVRESSYYILHVYFPIEFEMAPDPVRPPGGEYRELVDQLILGFLRQHSIPFHTATGSESSRLAAFLNAVRGLGVVPQDSVRRRKPLKLNTFLPRRTIGDISASKCSEISVESLENEAVTQSFPPIRAIHPQFPHFFSH
jgi:nicotinamide riboside kinase